MPKRAAELHVPVLLDEVLASLQPESGKIYVDGTLGLGGHTSAILAATAPAGKVIAFEWDKDAVSLATERLCLFGDRLEVVEASYADILDELQQLGITSIDGLLVDLGVSSLQFDRGERGFSFKNDAALDMRMNQDKNITAADIIKKTSEEELADILYHYGEERQARRIARFICEQRGREAITTTLQLAELVKRAVPRRFHPDKIHMATRTFQALRIAVNRELDNLVRLLEDAPKVLRPGAKFCVISFHSLEDRIVKQAFKTHDLLRVVTRKPIEPTSVEIRNNARSRSARLRVAVRV